MHKFITIHYRDLYDKALPKSLPGVVKWLICASVKAHMNYHKWKRYIVFEIFMTITGGILKLSMSFQILASKNLGFWSHFDHRNQ